MKNIINKIRNKTEYLIKTSKVFNREGYLEAKHEKDGKYPIKDNIYHIKKAVEWLKQAQDAASDGGVARGYSLTWNPYFRSKGWQPSYPETTGYIIPTFFKCAKYFKDHDLFQRAIRMAKWEMDVRLNNGAIQGGVIGEEVRVPSVFCTGQVIIGWIHAFKETNDVVFLNAAKQAGDFLLKVQNENGQLLEDSKYTHANKNTTAYHSRVAWSLILLGKAALNEKYIQAGFRNIEFNLESQESSGWFRNNCIWDAEQPLLHTICYATRGLLEAGVLLNNNKFIDAAKLPADRLLLINESSEFLPGRFDKNWDGTVSWSCLTGDAQLAIIWLKLYRQTKNINYLSGARKIIRFLKTTQNCSTSNPGLRGGIKGPFPFNTGYAKFQILNWATKFYVDALLLESIISEDK